jgi:hypothetical protein
VPEITSYYCHRRRGIIVNTAVTKKRGNLLKTRHIHAFEIPLPQSTVTALKYPDKRQLRGAILVLRAERWSYREIGREVGLHWTRVGQILNLPAPDDFDADL